LKNRSKCGEGKGDAGKRKEGNHQEGERGKFGREDKKRKREVTEGTDSGLHHPAIEDGENSYSLRESGSLEDSSGWPKEWQC